jgi:hypothetical protein
MYQQRFKVFLARATDDTQREIKNEKIARKEGDEWKELDELR